VATQIKLEVCINDIVVSGIFATKNATYTLALILLNIHLKITYLLYSLMKFEFNNNFHRHIKNHTLGSVRERVCVACKALLQQPIDTMYVRHGG
jgi:hypothetical protein